MYIVLPFIKARVKLLTFESRAFFGCGPLRLPGYLLALGKAIADVVQLPRVFPNQDVCLHGSFPEMLSHYGLYKRSLLPRSFQYESGFKSVRDISEEAIGPQTIRNRNLRSF